MDVKSTTADTTEIKNEITIAFIDVICLFVVCCSMKRELKNQPRFLVDCYCSNFVSRCQGDPDNNERRTRALVARARAAMPLPLASVRLRAASWGVWEFGNAEPGSGSGRALFPVFTVRTISGIRIWISSDSTTHGIDIGSTYLEPRYCRTLNYLIRSLLLM